MGKPLHDDLIITALTRDIKNAYLLLGIDLSDLSSTRPWTPDGDALLIADFEAGYRIPQMATEYRRTEEDVERRICVLAKAGRLDLNKWDKEQKAVAV
ncbi:MAG: hypothetical protein KGZ56_00875 [Dethiobacter sp.]|nr:hypothetical protein [Dethiobacter sp.]MBS3898686.1 hypothetical protein [Dethiobacter sp.]